MFLFAMILAVSLSSTTPSLEELLDRTEPWVRDDVTVTSETDFHTSDFLREGEPVLLLHHAFLDDENETLHTVICTDTRVIVLEEGIVQREIQLVHPVSQVAASPSGTYLVAYRETEIPTEIRSLRINTETGEQISFSTHPGIELSYAHVGIWPRDDGSLFSSAVPEERLLLRGLMYPIATWFFAPDLSYVTGPVMGSFGKYIGSSKEAELIFVHAAPTLLQGVAYDRSGNLLWRLPEGIAGLNSVAVSNDGQLVGLGTRHGAILIDGASGRTIDVYDDNSIIGGLLISPSSNRVLYRHLNEGRPWEYTSVNLEAQESVTTEVVPFVLPAHSLTDDGSILLAGGRSNSCILLDDEHTPIYAWSSEYRPHPISLSPSGTRLVHAIASRDGLPGFTIIEMERGN